jgi:thymidylate synthase (FAD)
MASYAQRSQRYCEEDGFDFITPPTIKPLSAAWDVYTETMADLEKAYENLRSLGIPAEDARMLLPNACSTVIEVSMNGRELIHFCNERMCSRAQWEIRELANLMAAAVKEHDEQCEQFAKFLIPKCEAKGLEYAICPEAKPCKERHHPRLKDIFKKLSVDKA